MTVGVTGYGIQSDRLIVGRAPGGAGCTRQWRWLANLAETETEMETQTCVSVSIMVSVLFGHVSRICTGRSALQPAAQFFFGIYFLAPETERETETETELCLLSPMVSCHTWTAQRALATAVVPINSTSLLFPCYKLEAKVVARASIIISLDAQVAQASYYYKFGGAKLKPTYYYY